MNGNLKRLASTVGCDVRLQFRNGFYYATALVTAIYALALSQVSQVSQGRTGVDFSALLPVFVLDSMLIGTFYFVAGLVLLEKGEGTLEAQVVTPLRAWEYLTSKVITLTLLTLAQYLVIVGIYEGLSLGTLAFMVGVALAASMYVLLGFISVARYSSVSEYLFPSIPYVGLLMLPLFTYVLGDYLPPYLGYLIYLHPLQGPMEVMRAAFGPVGPWRLAYGLVFSALWIGILHRWSLRAFARFVVATAGAATS